MDSTTEMNARRAVFKWLDGQTMRGEREISRDQLQRFEFEGAPLKLLDTGRGIRNPAAFSNTLSVMTSFDSPYADEEITGGLIKYHYQRDDRDVAKLQEAARSGVPVVYLKGIRPAVFLAFYPAYVLDSPDDRTVLLALDEDLRLLGQADEMTVPQRRYADRAIRQRLHQPQFRANVMHAYAGHCAICSLGHRELLDAAHILPDSSLRGVPATSNGIALCKIHHSAYDNWILGIRPDSRIEISRRTLEESDGPMLRHGLQAMHGVLLKSPRRHIDRPDAGALEVRYQEFLQRN